MKFCTTSEAAYLLGLSPGRIRQLVLEGRMAGQQRIGRDWFVTYPPRILAPKKRKQS